MYIDGQVRSAMECPGWGGLNINATEATIFRVTIGTSGGARGYPSITGNALALLHSVVSSLYYIPGLSGSEIAYYINDTMIPVLRLRRGVTYTFIVEAGNDPNDVPNYHPFYITDSEDGGILLDTAEEKMVISFSIQLIAMHLNCRERMNKYLLALIWILVDLQ